MNNILKKVLEELKTEKPRIDYVIGMLETLIEMQEPKMMTKEHVDIISQKGDGTPVAISVSKPKDEGAMLDAMAAAQIKKTQETVAKSLE